MKAVLVKFTEKNVKRAKISFSFASAMGKKKNQSLPERIATLINRVGEKPEPTFGVIKSELVGCLGLAEALQDGAAIRDAESKVEILETEKTNLKTELETLQTEVEAFRAERRKQQEEERKREIPPEQLDILRRLGSRHGGKGLTVLQIWREVGHRLDETEIHVDKLAKAGLIEWHEDDGEQFWRRTMPGNELVVAKRLAGEEETEEQEEELPELTHMETLVLMALAHGNCAPEYIEEYIAAELPVVGPPITSPGMMLLLLIKLREKKLVSEADKPSDSGLSEWKLLRAGTRLLSARRLM